MRRSAAAGVVALALATGLAGQSRFQVVEKTIDDIHASMKSGNLTARELIQAYLDRIDAFDKKGPAINCIITLNSQALDEADKLVPGLSETAEGRRKVAALATPDGQFALQIARARIALGNDDISELDKALTENVPGVKFGFSQPIEMRVNELVAGVKSDVAALLYGPDLDVLRQNLRVARGFQPMTAEEMQALRDRCAKEAGDGRHEVYKLSLKFDNPQARLPHGFPVDLQQKEVQEMLYKEAGGP